MWAPGPDQMLFVILSCVCAERLGRAERQSWGAVGAFFPDAVLKALRAEWPEMGPWEGERPMALSRAELGRQRPLSLIPKEWVG